MKKITPIEYLNLNSSVGKILYYPGAGKDFGPIELFVNNGSVDTVIFADYSTEFQNPNDIFENLRGWEPNNIQPLNPNLFGKKTWKEFWPDNSESLEFALSENAFGYRMTLYLPSGKKCNFFYLGTEGIQTYNILVENGYIPDVIVLQDHGTGGNWSHFGGEDSPLFKNAFDNLPSFILCADNTPIWPGYERMTESKGNLFAMHENSKRAIYKKV